MDVIGPHHKPVQGHFISVSLLFCEAVVLFHAITVWSIATCQVTCFPVHKSKGLADYTLSLRPRLQRISHAVFRSIFYLVFLPGRQAPARLGILVFTH